MNDNEIAYKCLVINTGKIELSDIAVSITEQFVKNLVTYCDYNKVNYDLQKVKTNWLDNLTIYLNELSYEVVDAVKRLDIFNQLSYSDIISPLSKKSINVTIDHYLLSIIKRILNV